MSVEGQVKSVKDVIIENEEVTAAGYNDLNSRVIALEESPGIDKVGTITDVRVNSSTVVSNGARAVAAVIWMIRNGWSKNNIKSWISEQFGYDLSYSYEQLKNQHKFECICQRSVPAAIICWLNANSYEDGIRKAVSLGGDADTEAAITGAFLNADENTEVSDDFAKEVTRFFSMDFMDILNKFHNEYEIGK